jgi:hypothetical protein
MGRYSYTARKGDECVFCIFDNVHDMIAGVVRHMNAGFTIKAYPKGKV